ncbi:ATP-binding protein [Fodinibius sp.]|uniref:ATP-binding protein n=1 Tax=Fodinibius sp. TaxID=1872440 RepID=UPI002ACE382E|nr:AAA family ATPase [Fodinibius sp.]MDZ7658031.1 AAA family ATPase [Fodinibius sp.]
MKLQKLILKNFKGIRDYTFEADGRSMNVFGRNETGKTTLFDAMTWLLTGKDSRDRSADSFGIKTRDKNGDVIHNIEHEVEGVFDEITLKRCYQEKWTRKRGASQETFSGHTTDYWVDGEPVKANEYQEAVEEIMPERLLKILTMPDYFPEQMHWSDRRDVLFDLVGDIDTEEIITNYGDLERYPKVLDGKSHEAREKILKEKRRDLDKELDNIPGRIDELNGRLYTDIGDVEEAKATVTELKEKKDTIEAKRSEVKSGGRVAELKVERNELQAKKQKLKNEHQQQIQDSLSDQRQKVNELQNKVDEAEPSWRESKREYESSSAEDRLSK